ncbi:DUF502 domain-containing protein [Hellea sp.]|nr:DUF502 domain-containing protein [Hellea sp.]
MTSKKDTPQKWSFNRTFSMGLMALLPLAVTLAILHWIVSKIAGLIGPNSLFGKLLEDSISLLTGPSHKWLSYGIGVLITGVLIWFLGLMVQTRARGKIGPVIDKLLKRTPVIGTIYKPVSQVVSLISKEGDAELKSMTVVTCEYGGVECIGLLTSLKIYQVKGKPRKMVFLPHAPVPMTGNLVLIAADSITPMPDMSVDEFLQLSVSLGMVTPEESPLS